MTHPALISAAEVLARLERALVLAPADETELVWLESVTGTVATDGGAAPRTRGGETEPRAVGELLVRVHERGRVGTHRGGGCECPDIAAAIRQALAQARVHAPLAGMPHLPADDTPTGAGDLTDPAVLALDSAGAFDLLRRAADRGDRARLSWTTGQAVLANSRGLRRRAQATSVSVSTRSGEGPGAGSASQAARSLADLDLPAAGARARARAAAAAAASDPGEGPLPLWLSPEATAALVRATADGAFAAHTYRDGTSFLRDHLGVQVFDRRIALRDDGSDPRGLPFPFDFEGTAKHAVELITAGTPRTPALDQRHAALLGLPATGHAAGGDDARAEHLFLQPGEASEEELAAAAAGGLWVGELSAIELYDPRRASFRARARGVRRVGEGGLGARVPDLLWHGNLLGALANVLAVGRQTVRVAGGTWLGGTVAPALVLGEVAGLRLPSAAVGTSPS